MPIKTRRSATAPAPAAIPISAGGLIFKPGFETLVSVLITSAFVPIDDVGDSELEGTGTHVFIVEGLEATTRSKAKVEQQRRGKRQEQEDTAEILTPIMSIRVMQDVRHSLSSFVLSDSVGSVRGLLRRFERGYWI